MALHVTQERAKGVAEIEDLAEHVINQVVGDDVHEEDVIPHRFTRISSITDDRYGILQLHDIACTLG